MKFNMKKLAGSNNYNFFFSFHSYYLKSLVILINDEFVYDEILIMFIKGRNPVKNIHNNFKC